MELNFTVTNQKIKYVSNLYIVEKSRNYLTAKFSFSGSEWKGVAKTAIFKKDDTVINVLLDENGRCNVPWEVITKGTLRVSVFGGDLVTVDTADVKILKSGYEEGNAPSEPTPDVYAQILKELQDIRSEVISEEVLEQLIEEWLANNMVDVLSKEDVEKIVEDYIDKNKDELMGVTFTPHISDDGVLSWTNDGGLENPPEVQLSIGGGSTPTGDYALLNEAGYSIEGSVASNTGFLTLNLLNKAGETLSTKTFYFPFGQMFNGVTIADGLIQFKTYAGVYHKLDISPLLEGLEADIANVESIAKGKNRARVFATTEDMNAWLSDANNIGVAMKGDNLYIVELDVPDWWIAEVLDAPNASGMYYEIAQLETQKVDLSNYMPLSGGTMTGDINTNHIVPNIAGNYACGKYSSPWASVASVKYAVRNTEGTAGYGELTVSTEGTSETVGISDLALGNKAPEGTEGNAIGQLTLYGKERYYSRVKSNDVMTKNIQVTLPNQSGVLALQSEVINAKAGSVTVTGVSSSSKVVSVTFAEPMKDSNYAINLTPQYANSYNTLVWAVSNKTANGFEFRVANEASTDTSSINFPFYWTATPYNS